jgi:hypothetical protein
MMSSSQIAALSAKAARKAARTKGTPLLVEREDVIDKTTLFEHLRQMPFLGTYEPEGWNKVEELFVDSSGFGAPDEPAMTQEQFLKAVKPGLGYAITEAGEFQVYVGVYKPIC